MGNICSNTNLNSNDLSSLKKELNFIRRAVCNVGSGGGSSLPDQTGHAGEFLTTNGSVASWAAAGGGGAYWALTGTSTLTGDATIDGDTWSINLRSLQSLSLVVDNTTTFSSINLQPNFISIQAGDDAETVYGRLTFDGTDITARFIGSGTLKYFADYSADFTVRSLVDKGYVTAAIAAIPSGITGTMVANRIPYGVSASVLTTSAGLAFDGTNVLTIGGMTVSDNASRGRLSPSGGILQLFTFGNPGLLDVYSSSGDTSLTLTVPTNSVAQISTTGQTALQIQPAATGLVGIGVQVPTAKLHVAASTTARAAMNLTQGVAPTSPNDGDIWREDNTNTGLKIRVNGVTKTFTLA